MNTHAIRPQSVNLLWPSDAVRRHRPGPTMALEIVCNGTKPLPEQTLTNHQWGLVAFIWENNLQDIYISYGSEYHWLHTPTHPILGVGWWRRMGNDLESFDSRIKYAIPLIVKMCNQGNHDDVIKWKHFPHYCPFVRGIHRSPVNSQHKGQWRKALMFSLICAWTSGWVTNRETGDLRRHRAHYDIIVMPLHLGYTFDDN